MPSLPSPFSLSLCPRCTLHSQLNLQYGHLATELQQKPAPDKMLKSRAHEYRYHTADYFEQTKLSNIIYQAWHTSLPEKRKKTKKKMLSSQWSIKARNLSFWLKDAAVKNIYKKKWRSSLLVSAMIDNQIYLSVIHSVLCAARVHKSQSPR